MDQDEEIFTIPPKAEQLASLIEGKAVFGPVKMLAQQVSLRFHVLLLARLDALAATTGKSRNFITQECTEAGVEAVMEGLSPSTRRKIEKATAKRARELMSGATEEEE